MILVHASPKTLAPYRTENLGVLSSPRRFYKESEGIETWPWAADNDAFSKWDEGRYRDMLDGIEGLEGCLFVTAPDVVAKPKATLALFGDWLPTLVDVGQPIALVGQDGLAAESVPWDDFSAFFVGGSTEWKLGNHAAGLIREAKERGKWVHMGRVNSYQRARYARWLGCDSIDGTQFSWFRDAKLPGHLNALRQEVLSGL